MSGNFLIQKKLERDTGLAQNPGAHLRTNLKEIVAVEHLFVAEGWLENTCEKKTKFENLDQTSILGENLNQFWALCGQNRDSGVASILEKQLSLKLQKT